MRPGASSFAWARPARGLPSTHRRLALAGWILYLLSWVTPGLREGQLHFGAASFVTTIRLALTLVFRSDSLPALLVGLALLGGWLANFSLLMRFPVWARVAWIVLPWFPFGFALYFTHTSSVMQSLMSLLYFYPWVAGITLVHVAAIADASTQAR